MHEAREGRADVSYAAGDWLVEKARALGVFGQISNGLDRMYEGAGIGLPIVKKLAEMHGAELSLSTPRDGGTRAQIRFPRYRTAAGSNQRSLAG